MKPVYFPNVIDCVEGGQLISRVITRVEIFVCFILARADKNDDIPSSMLVHSA